MIKLSIVLPVYGVEIWIERCLRSVLDDPVFVSSCELIIVDDGSPDRSIEIAEKVCAGYDNVKLIRQVNKGLGAARNAGAAVVQGQYLWFIDSDDWLSEGGLSRVLNALLNNRGVEVLNIDYVMSNGEHSTVPNHAKPGERYRGLDYLDLSVVQNPVQYYIFSSEYYRKNKLMFESGLYHEDALFTPVALYFSNAVIRLAEDCYVYNLREGSIMNSGNPMRHASDMVRIVEKLEKFRLEQVKQGSDVLAKYSALAVGAIYYYWKKLNRSEKIKLVGLVGWRGLLDPVIAAGKWKYLISIIRIKLFYWVF
jgi:glycosyltransferase involved in cell wall biosynthesis